MNIKSQFDKKNLTRSINNAQGKTFIHSLRLYNLSGKYNNTTFYILLHERAGTDASENVFDKIDKI